MLKKAGRVAMVTGAGSGIGRAVSAAFRTAGFSVVLTGRRQHELEITAAMGDSEDTSTLVFPADISDPSEVRNLFEQTAKSFGRLDVLFNNAGIGAPAIPIEDISDEQWLAVVGVNLTGSFFCAREAIRLMKRQEPSGGRIINNGSISAHVPRPYSAPYTATKHAITGLTKSISLDNRKFNIVCSQIDIGNAATPMTDSMVSGVLQANGTIASEPRIDVQHVASAVLYVATLPLDVNVQFMTVMAASMPFIGRG